MKDLLTFEWECQINWYPIGVIRILTFEWECHIYWLPNRNVRLINT